MKALLLWSLTCDCQFMSKKSNIWRPKCEVKAPLFYHCHAYQDKTPEWKKNALHHNFIAELFVYICFFCSIVEVFSFFSKQDLMKVKIVDYSLSYDQGSWLLIILLPSHEFWDYRHMLPYSDLSFVFKEHLTDYVSIPFCTFFNFSFLRPYIIL